MQTHLQPLVQGSLTRSFPAGSIILYQGEAPRSACILTKGVVKVFSTSAQGNEQIVMLHIAGEFFPSAWIFGKATGTLFFYVALTDCEIAFTTRNELLSFMQATPERSQALLDYYTTNFAASLIRVSALQQPKARDKLVYTLYFLCQRFSKEQTPRIHIPIDLTHQTLASFVGLTRETTAMEMSALKKERVISYAKQRYTINLEKLMDAMGEDNLREISIAD